jgi:ABC-2 type transport system permease protein
MIPTLFAVLILPDSFAGERERRTLPTLLASRLPDRAILYGKIGMAVSLGWGVTLIVLLLGLVTVNIAHWDGQLLLYSPTIALGNIVLSGLIATLASAAGALVSLRATSVQEAIQAVAMVFMVPGMAVGGLLLIVGAVLGPELKDWLADLDFSQIILSVAVVLALIDLAVLKAVKARFRRSQLTLV